MAAAPARLAARARPRRAPTCGSASSSWAPGFGSSRSAARCMPSRSSSRGRRRPGLDRQADQGRVTACDGAHVFAVREAARGGASTCDPGRSQAGGRRCRCIPRARVKVTAGREGSPSPFLHGTPGTELRRTSRRLGVDLDVEGRSAERARGRVRGVPGLFADLEARSYEPDGPCVPEFPRLPAAFAASLAACAAAFACRCASELVRPGLSGFTWSSAS
jgi:hypothetical protein